MCCYCVLRCVSLAFPSYMVCLVRSCTTHVCFMLHVHVQPGSLTCNSWLACMDGDIMLSTHGCSDMPPQHMTAHVMHSCSHGGTRSYSNNDCSTDEGERHTHTHAQHQLHAHPQSHPQLQQHLPRCMECRSSMHWLLVSFPVASSRAATATCTCTSARSMLETCTCLWPA